MNKKLKAKIISNTLKEVSKALASGKDVRIWNFLDVNKDAAFVPGAAIRTGSMASDGTWTKIDLDELKKQ